MEALALQIILHKTEKLIKLSISRYSSAGVVLISSGSYRKTAAGVFHGQFGKTYRLVVGCICRINVFLGRTDTYCFRTLRSGLLPLVKL